MEIPATPAQAANPGSVPQVITTPPAAVPPAAASVPGQEGSVTIPLKEYRNLQRGAARALSFDKRAQLKVRAGATTSGAGDGSDPEAAQLIADAESRAAEAERRALQSEVRERTRGILEKDEFKVLPKSTRELILKNPHMATTAETLEEAMLDIEDFVRDQVLSIEMPGTPGGTTPPNTPPASNEVPPVVSGGAPAPAAPAAGLEDLSKLHGPARSQAAIRNLVKSRGAK